MATKCVRPTAFGNALGESIVAEMQPQTDSPYSLAGLGAKFGSGGSSVRLGTGDDGGSLDYFGAGVRFPSSEEWGGTLQGSLDELRLMSVGADSRDGPLTDAQRAMLAAGRGPLTAGAAAAASMQDDVPTAMAGNTDEPSAQRVAITGQRAPWYERLAYRLQNMFDPESNVHVNLARDTTLIGLPSRLMGGLDAIARGPAAYDDDGEPLFWNERMQGLQRQEEIGLEAASVAMVPTPGPRGLAVARSGLAFGERPTVMGANDGPQLPIGSMMPNDGPQLPTAYSVLAEMKLSPADFGRSRSVHYNRANAELDSLLGVDSDFAALLDARVPGVQGSVSSVGGRATPPGWTWEHASTSTASGQAGVMRLVPTEQHTPGSPFWRVIHPDTGARGGYSEWAIPAGAPKNGKR